MNNTVIIVSYFKLNSQVSPPRLFPDSPSTQSTLHLYAVPALTSNPISANTITLLSPVISVVGSSSAEKSEDFSAI